MLEISQIFTDATGNSHFDTFPVNMENHTDVGYLSENLGKVKRCYFQNTLPHHVWEFHTEQNTIYFVVLEGEAELEVSDGQRKKFGKGSVVCLDDHSGKGHKVKTFDSTVSTLVIEME